MVIKNVRIIGLEVRHSVDPRTKVSVDKYYIHGIYPSDNLISGDSVCFSGKLPDLLSGQPDIGGVYDICFRSYNGYNTVEAFYGR